MLQLLLSRDWTASRNEILRRVSADVRRKQGGRILMVPELISHDTERRLCATAGDTASRFAEVLSFTRLARRVSDSVGAAAQECLDNGGRVVAMAAAAQQLHSRLKAYAAVETKPEFLTGLIDAVDEFKRCCITAKDLKQAAGETEGSLSQKLEELSLLLETYDALCQWGKRDPRDQMTWVLEQLEDSGFAREHVFYIDGFPDFTRQHFAILEHLIIESPQVTVSLNCDKPGSRLLAFEKAGQTAADLIRAAQKAGVAVEIVTIPDTPVPLLTMREKLFQGAICPGCLQGKLFLSNADSPYGESMNAAEQIMELIRSGNRYRDITIVCSDTAVYEPLIKFVFHRYGIPVYQSGTEDILQKSVIVTVLSAMDAALGGFDRRDVMRYLRSALSPLDPDTCDEVENYGILWGIRGKRWLQPWENHPDGLGQPWTEDAKNRLNQLNRVREDAFAPLLRLAQGFFDATNLEQQVLALYTFLTEIHLEERLGQLAEEMDEQGDNRSAQILNQLWEILLGAMEQLHDVLGATVWAPENFTRLFRLLLSQYDIGTIPPVLDAVQVGPVSAMRCHQEKYLFVLGAQEGCLPGYTGSAGILTDQERVALRKLGVPLTGGAMEGIQAEFAEIYGVFCGAETSVWVSYSGDQPSFVYRRLAELAGGEQKNPAPLGFAQACPEEAAAYLLKWDEAATADRLHLAKQYQEAMARRDYAMGAVGHENIRRLYGKVLNLSASQIDTQAECRLSYFLKYGLRAKERKEATVDPAEFGTYVHAVLENTARCIKDMGGFSKVSLDETLAIAKRYSDEYAKERFSQIDSERLSYLFRRNGQELDMIVRELWEELRESRFEPADFEVNFGSDNGLPAIPILGSAMYAVLRGFIDRVDTWHTGSNDYYRVVDYKTGRKDFDYCDVFNGVGLQMLLYLFALKQSGAEIVGDNPIPAGVQYFPARVPYISTDGPMDDSAQKERSKVWKRKGLLLRDDAVLQAMEPGDSPKRMCYTVKKDGTMTGDLASREQLAMLKEYVFRVLGKMVDEIASGCVEPNPYTRGTSHSACAFCPYGEICHKETVEGRRNYKTMDASRFWEDVEKEMKRHG